VGLVLWIDQNTFATGLLEKVFKKKALPFYTIPNAQDFVYLVEDLNPVVIVLDTKTAMDNLEAFKAQYESIKDLPFILIDHRDELSFISKVVGSIKRPFDPFQVPAILNQILKAN
jgi:DNA-binding NtrC family response regulator